VQSANDAAVALAVHVAGSTEAFVALMNRRAAELGMKDTMFSSVHGLPPSLGQKPDETTAHDLALLSRELIKKQEIFEYTGTRERSFREGKFILRSHNHLLGLVEGCDGFKTGYFQAAGFSIVATAKRDDVRIIAIVMGSKDRKVRDAKATELLAKGFALVPPKPIEVLAVNKPEVTQEKLEVAVSTESSVFQPPENLEEVVEPSGRWGMFFWGLFTGLMLSGLLTMFISRKRSRKPSRSRGYL
jgi:D-alanyl-D-alanine carboxypeptidase (penicillin-binding protein 5/6)